MFLLCFSCVLVSFCSFFDGFGAHLLSVKEMETHIKHKIVCVKEEGDDSHINQAYNKYVGRGDKAAKLECLPYIKAFFRQRNKKIDQWSLVHTGLFAIRSTEAKA